MNITNLKIALIKRNLNLTSFCDSTGVIRQSVTKAFNHDSITNGLIDKIVAGFEELKCPLTQQEFMSIFFDKPFANTQIDEEEIDA